MKTFLGKEAKKDKDSSGTKADGDGGVKRKLVDGEYDPSSPTSEASNDDTPPAKKMTIDGGKSQVC